MLTVFPDLVFGTASDAIRFPSTSVSAYERKRQSFRVIGHAGINAFERLLADNGTRILKFYLHISKEEQLARFAARLDDPAKNWKISEADYEERAHWDAYAAAFEEAFARCSTDIAPWFVITADKKWYRNFVIARILREEMQAMNFQMPPPSVDLEDIRRRYLSEVEASDGT